MVLHEESIKSEDLTMGRVLEASLSKIEFQHEMNPLPVLSQTAVITAKYSEMVGV